MRKKTLDLTNIKAAIFDIDGTMVNNNDFHKEAFIIFGKKHGVVITDEFYTKELSGNTNERIMPKLFGDEITQEEIAQYGDEKEAIYREIYDPHFKPLTGLIELIESLRKKKITLAIASNAPELNRIYTLEKLGLHDQFATIVGVEHVTQGKPHPEMYLTVAKNIQTEPEFCIVFEDSPKGIEAAKRAKMKAVGLTTSHTSDELGDADIIVEDFTQLRV